MKIHIKWPWGGEFYYERERREPMDMEKFGWICVLVGIAMFLSFLLWATK